MIDFELKLPATKKTRDQIIKDLMIESAKRTSSKGAYDKFKKKILDARKKDDELKKKKKISALDYVDSMVALHEPDIATNRQKAVLKIQEDKASEIEAAIRKRNIGDKKLEKYFDTKKVAKKIPVIPPKPDLPNGHSDWTTEDWLHSIDSSLWMEDKRAEIQEEDLFGKYLELLKGGELLPGTSFEMFEKNFRNYDTEIISKIKKEINKRIAAKKRVEGLAALMGISPGEN